MEGDKRQKLQSTSPKKADRISIMNEPTKDIEQLKILRNQLKIRKNRSYISWWILHRRKVGWQMHHVLSSTMAKKLNDLLLANVTWEEHERITYKGYLPGEFERLFCEALNDVLDFLELTQEKLNK